MAKSITEFKSQLKKGGARPNLFLVKTAQIPASNIGTIEVPFRGRMLKVAGDRTFEPWSVTVINDGAFEIRQAFEAWSRGINALTENASQLGYGSDGGRSYCADMTVYQLSRDGQTPSKTPSNPNNGEGAELDIIRAYKFYDAWPSSISSIDLSFEANDQIEEFTVEFQYNFFEATSKTLS